MLDLTNHQDAALAGLLQIGLEYRLLFLQSEVQPASTTPREYAAVTNNLPLDESVALFTDPSDRQASDLGGLLQTHGKSQRENHCLGLTQLFNGDCTGNGLHCTIDNFLPACSSDHGESLLDEIHSYRSIDMKWNDSASTMTRKGVKTTTA